MDDAFEIVAWSFRQLVIGRYPHKDHRGKYFPPSSWRGKKAGTEMFCKGACLGNTGDWAWLKQVVGLRGWNDGKNRCCCWWCKARFVEGSYDDASLSARWRTTLLNMTTFWAMMGEEGMFCSKAWSIPGMRLSFMRPDWMHTVDLGITAYLSGHILFHLFTLLGGKRYGAVTKQNSVCNQIMNMVQIAARHAGCETPEAVLTLERFRAKKAKPKLKLKAADSRYYLPALLATLRLFFSPKSDRDHMMHGCVAALVDIYAELDAWDTTTSPPLIAGLARRHIILYKELHETSPDKDLWALYPKNIMCSYTFAKIR